MSTLNEYRDKAFVNAVVKGFHDEDRGNPTYLMLMVSELGEACEADRKGKFVPKGCDVAVLLEESDDDWYKRVFEHSFKDTFEDELADTLIRILDLAGMRGIDLQAHVEAKMRYNTLRPRLHGKLY